MDINSFVIGYKKGKASGGSGGGSGGGVELNIAYGDTAPEDTTKLWVKTTQPSGVVVSKDMEIKEGSMSITTLSEVVPKGFTRSTSAVVGEKIYLFGARRASTRGYSNTILCFDTKTETLKTLSATLPNAGSPAAAPAIGSKIYLLGGDRDGGTLNTILCFDINTETLTTLSATLPFYGGDGMLYFTKESKIYFTSGSTTSATELRTKLFCFDPETGAVETLTDVIAANWRSSAIATVGNKMYAFGSNATTFDNKILCLDTETETLTTLSVTVPENRHYMEASAIGSKIYLFGGTNTNNIYNVFGVGFDTILCFDTETETLTTTSEVLPKKQIVGTAETVENGIYLFSGRPASNFVIDLDTIYYFSDGVLSLLKDEMQIVPAAEKNIFRVLNSQTARVEIGVQKVYKGNENNEAVKVEAALYKDGSWATI